MQAILEKDNVTKLTVSQHEATFGDKIGLIGKIFGCWHKELSRPFSDKNSAYRTCLHCGARKRFDANNLQTYGPFYYPPAISPKAAS